MVKKVALAVLTFVFALGCAELLAALIVPDYTKETDFRELQYARPSRTNVREEDAATDRWAGRRVVNVDWNPLPWSTAPPTIHRLERNKKNVLLLGGSSVEDAGRFEQLTRRIRDPDVRVFNMGVSGFSSEAIKQVFMNVAGFSPRVVIIYAGHNNYWRVMESVASGGFSLHTYNVSLFLMRHSNLYRGLFALHWGPRLMMGPTGIYEDVKRHMIAPIPPVAEASWKGGCPLAVLTDEARDRLRAIERDLVAGFVRDIESIARVARKVGTAVVVVTPIAHPLWPLAGDYLARIPAGSSVAAFRRDFSKASAAVRTGATNAPTLLAKLARSYPDNGLVSALHARHYEKRGDFARVRAHERDIIDNNYQPTVAKSPLVKAIRSLADEKNGVHVVDFNAYFFDEVMRGRPVDSTYFKDHIHLMPKTYDLLAARIHATFTSKHLLEGPAKPR